MRKAPSLRSNNGALQVRVRLDGRDVFINRLGRWDDPVAVARAQAISAQIWSDYKEGTFDRSLLRYMPLVKGQQVGLLEAMQALADSTHNARCIHAMRVVKGFGKPLRNCSDVEDFVRWMQAKPLANRTIAGILQVCRNANPSNRQLFTYRLTLKQRSVQSDVLSVEEIGMVLRDMKEQEQWFYPLFLLWLSTGLRNAEIRGLTWDCIRWSEGELLICKTLRRDGYSSGKVAWAPTKTGKERVVPLTPQVLETLLEHQCLMQEQGLYQKQGLVFLSPDTFTNVYDHLLGRVWHRSLKRCGLPPRRLYAQRHSFLSHALAMGNSPADLAQIAGHSTEILLKTYAKPTGRVKLPCWSA
jgi:integrase